ncbi:MAG TPA: hypothetical protein VHB98_14480 [Chloroflexota bacterium]|jgi:hypothetical protein|nr:hypothetical protein [Chloroflexota bacterium]
MLKHMQPVSLNTPPPMEPDHPEPLPPVRGRGFLLERLLTVNALVSMLMLSWSFLVLRRPARARRAWHALCRRFPGFVGGTPAP